MFKKLLHVDILGKTAKRSVVLERLVVGILGLTHSHKAIKPSYTPFYTQQNQKLIPLKISKFVPVNFRLYPLSTGPIITTTYINTNKD